MVYCIFNLKHIIKMGIIDPAPDSPPALDKIIKNIIITIPIHFFTRLYPNSLSILGI